MLAVSWLETSLQCRQLKLKNVSTVVQRKALYLDLSACFFSSLDLLLSSGLYLTRLLIAQKPREGEDRAEHLTSVEDAAISYDDH